MRPPADAVERLWQALGGEHEHVRFARVGPDIRASTDEDTPTWMTHDERTEIGRRAILKLVGEVCEETGELKTDWFAVSSER
jgi:hypothetical protein